MLKVPGRVYSGGRSGPTSKFVPNSRQQNLRRPQRIVGDVIEDDRRRSRHPADSAVQQSDVNAADVPGDRIRPLDVAELDQRTEEAVAEVVSQVVDQVG